MTGSAAKPAPAGAVQHRGAPKVEDPGRGRQPLPVPRRWPRFVLPSAAAGALVLGCHLAGMPIAGLVHLGQTYPLAGSWRSTVTGWLAVPVLAAVLVCWGWPRLVRRLRWRPLLAVSTVVAAGWSVALSLADGPSGLTAPLAPYQQYPHDVPRVADLGSFLPTFAEHVVDPTHGPVWAVHVGGHPPGALALFVLLDRIGLGGLGPAAALCILGGALAVPSVLALTRLFAGAGAGRRAALFVPVAPAALWIASSADAVFAGVAAAGLCALAFAAARNPVGPAPSGRNRPVGPSRRNPGGGPGPGGRNPGDPDPGGRNHPGDPGDRGFGGRNPGGRGLGPGWRAGLLAALGGLALGTCLFLSYGLSLLVLPAVAVALFAPRAGAARRDWRDAVSASRIRPLLIGGGVVALLLVAARLAGFDWWHGLSLAAERTRTGDRSVHPPTVWQDRPTWYFLFANPAALVISVGPAAVAALGWLRRGRLLVLPAAAALAVLGALVSNLSKGEVERIYLPFALLMLPLTAMLPIRRHGRLLLAVQLGWAVLIALTITTWW